MDIIRATKKATMTMASIVTQVLYLLLGIALLNAVLSCAVLTERHAVLLSVAEGGGRFGLTQTVPDMDPKLSVD